MVINTGLIGEQIFAKQCQNFRIQAANFKSAAELHNENCRKKKIRVQKLSSLLIVMNPALNLYDKLPSIMCQSHTAPENQSHGPLSGKVIIFGPTKRICIRIIPL